MIPSPAPDSLHLSAQFIVAVIAIEQLQRCAEIARRFIFDGPANCDRSRSRRLFIVGSTREREGWFQRVGTWLCVIVEPAVHIRSAGADPDSEVRCGRATNCGIALAVYGSGLQGVNYVALPDAVAAQAIA